MHTLEFQAPIRDHRLTIQSDLLPAEATIARITVIFDTAPDALDEEKTDTRATEGTGHGPLAALRGCVPIKEGEALPLKREELYDRPCLR